MVRTGALVALVGAMLFLPVAAELPIARWIEVGIATDGTRAFVDANSLRDLSSQIEATQRFLFAVPDNRGVSRVEQDVRYDCAAKTVHTLRIMEFDRDGRRIESEPPDPRKSEHIGEGTLAEYFAELLC